MQCLALRRHLQRLASAHIGRWATPARELLKQRPVFRVPLVPRHALERLQAGARAPSSQGRQGHRLERGTELRRAHLCGGPARVCTHQHQGIDIAGLTLIGGHAHGGVALQVLHRSVVLARGQGHVVRRDVVLKVHKDFAGLASQRPKCGFCGARVGRYLAKATDRCLAEPSCSNLGGMCHCAGKVKRTRAGTDHVDVKGGLRRGEHGRIVMPTQPASGHGIEVHGRCPASGTAHAVRLQRVGVAAIVGRNRHAFHRPPTLHCDDGAASIHRHALRRFAARGQSVIDDRHHVHAGSHEFPHRVVATVAGRGYDHIASAGHAVERGIALHGTGEHDARPVVVREQHRALEGAGGQNDAARADLPQPLAHRPADVLNRHCETMVVQAQNGAAGEHRDAALVELLALRLHVTEGLIGRAESPATQRLRTLHQQHILPGRGGRQRGCHAGGATTDHQHIHLARHFVVAIGVRSRISRRRVSQAGRGADQGLEPMPVRPHERLVIEARGHQSCQTGIDRSEIKTHARPGVSGLGHQPRFGFDLGGSRVGGAPGARTDIQQTCGLFHAAAEDAARAMQLEAAPHQGHAGGQQCGRHRVALQGWDLPAVELDVRRSIAVDPMASGGRESIPAHGVSPSGAESPIPYTASTT